MAILSIRSLVKSFYGRRVVDSVSFQIKSGRVVGLLGPNGAGKTTTFYLIVGMIKPNDGQVFLDDEEITMLPMYQRARAGIGYLPQEASIFRKLSVMDNVLAILETLPISKSDQWRQAEALLEELGILHLKEQPANVLSGGERRRLEISRSLATNPSFILLDEPFAGIDPIAVSDIKNIIAQLKSKNIGILISDHNVRETLQACDEAFILFDGKVIESGSPKKIAESEQAS